MNENELIIPQGELLKELDLFSPWSGPYLVRIMGDFQGYDSPIPLGSGGLLKYRNRYFVITNHHVISSLENIKTDIRIPYTVNESESYSMTTLESHSCSRKDVAIIEVRYNSNIEKSNHSFITDEYIDNDLIGYSMRTNITFIHGYPAFKTIVNSERKEIEATTFPYCTFIDRFDIDVNSLYVFVDATGVSKYNLKEEIPGVSGLSGSFVYGYYHNKFPSYKLIGVLTNYDKSESTLEIYPIKEFTDFIDEMYFGF